MSDESLQLSDELINSMVSVIVHHDSRAQEDMMLGLQYLSAVIGYIAASYPGSGSERDDLLQHLVQFSKHVADDRAASLQQGQQQAEQPQASAGHSEGTDDPAIGIWKPE